MAGYGGSPPRDDDDGEHAHTAATQVDFRPDIDNMFEILGMTDEGYTAVDAIMATDKTTRPHTPRYS